MQKELFDAINEDDEIKVKEILTYHKSDELLNGLFLCGSNKSLKTPLMYCIHSSKDIKYIKLLINAGSNVNVENNGIFINALGYALAPYINHEIVKLLLNNGANTKYFEKYLKDNNLI